MPRNVCLGYLGSLCRTHAKGYWSGADAESSQGFMFGIILNNSFGDLCQDLQDVKKEGGRYFMDISCILEYDFEGLN